MPRKLFITHSTLKIFLSLRALHPGGRLAAVLAIDWPLGSTGRLGGCIAPVACFHQQPSVLLFSRVSIIMSFSISTFISTYPLVGFSGSRAPSHQLSTACSQVLSTISSTPVAVGCAPGIDQLVRQAFPQARVFTAASQHPGALAARSAQLVRFIAASGGCLIVFPSSPCPSAVRVSSSFQGHGSGSWGSCAMALGLGLPVLVCALVPAASWQVWAGPLAACFHLVYTPGPEQCWLLAPGSTQLSLF